MYWILLELALVKLYLIIKEDYLVEFVNKIRYDANFEISRFIFLIFDTLTQGILKLQVNLKV
jgi:hypothetical protein